LRCRGELSHGASIPAGRQRLYPQPDCAAVGPDKQSGHALGAIADGGTIATLRSWRGPAERGITIRPISAFDAAGDTALLEEIRDLAEDGTLGLRVAEILPAQPAAEAHRRLAADGRRGRIVLDFETPLT
jgi:NADPH:quinone reductase